MVKFFGAVIFDLDGVIADSHPLHEQAWQMLLSAEGIWDAGADVAGFVRQGRTRSEMLRILFPGSFAQELARLSESKDRFYNSVADQLQPIPGVVSWIGELRKRGLPLAVATSASRGRTIETLDRFQLTQAFPVVVTASEVSCGKPDPELFLAAARGLRTAPQEVLVIEDSAAGVKAARAAGMECAAYCPSPDTEIAALRPNYTIARFDEISLAPLMNRLRAAAPQLA